MGRANLIFAQVTRTLKMKVVVVATAVVLMLLHGCCAMSAMDSEDVLKSCLHVHKKRVECGKDDAKDIEYKCHRLANHATNKEHMDMMHSCEVYCEAPKSLYGVRGPRCIEKCLKTGKEC